VREARQQLPTREVAGAPGLFQPPVTQRDIKAEVANFVGGVLSPLLCNAYLHRLDRAWSGAGHGRLVRFADDRVPRTLMEVAM
jgi:hypothetical protein